MPWDWLAMLEQEKLRSAAHEHKQEVRLLLPLGDQLISADTGGDVIVWDVQAGGRGISPTLNVEPFLAAAPILKLPSRFFLFPFSDVYLRLQFDPATFDVSAMMHPSTYLNKVLLGSSQGALQLPRLVSRSHCSAAGQ